MNNDIFSADIPQLDRFLKSLGKGSYCASGLTPVLKLIIINYILNKNKKVLFITENEQSALKYQKDFDALFEKEAKIFPYQEISPYSMLDKNYYIYKEQYEILKNKPNFVIAPIKALLEKFPLPDFYKNNKILLEKGKETDFSELIKKLTEFGYKRTTTTVDIGEFSLRGDILDIYSFFNAPCRIEFFSDEIEDIRFFNPNTQRSFEKAEFIEIPPLYKFLPDDTRKEKFKSELSGFLNGEEYTAFRPLLNETLEKIDSSFCFEGVEYYNSYITDDIGSVFLHFNDYILVTDESALINSKAELIDNEYNEEYKSTLETGFALPLKSKNHLTHFEYRENIKKFKRIGFDNFIENDFFEEDEDFPCKMTDFDGALLPVFSLNAEEISKFIKDEIKKCSKIFISTAYPKRTAALLNEGGIYSDDIVILPAISFFGGKFKINDKQYIFLTDRELFNKHSKEITSRKYMYNKQSPDYIESVNDIQAGEFVVHYIHGIGIFRGLVKQEFDGAKKDYLEIEFLGKDKLFMPAEQINLLKRYRGTGAVPKLSKMGGASWENIKNKAKKEVKEIAYDLLRLYAKRKIAKGISFLPDTSWQYEMEDAFEYVETQDQMKAINETKNDMEQSKPMDRLICADVGFGKTEIAIRAIFKAVMSGYQAALIAPTTILTLQHYQTIQERFKPFSINVQLLSRFKSPRERKKIIEELKTGGVDVVIGTHSLFSNIEYKNLGLLVIDEEHKFGVNHKEKLKKYRENIDILSLSATPIPRTLNMALSGLKDLSVINTPPKNRMPVKTYAGEFNETYIKNAINHELQRDGQVYFIHNRVENIAQKGKFIQELIPAARVAIAHGQMKEGELEKIMFDFLNKEYDILVSTAIVESGLDIPNVNTIIINDADKFGLAQLYQLRGRVGRADRQAYCYCFYNKSKQLNEEAIKRLKAITEFTSLGSGYRIAMRDIEIRGVGNILGTRQHGHMVNVGFDTYCSLLEESVEEIKKEGLPPAKKETFEPCLVDIKTNAYIPDDWAGSYEQKMIEYKKLAEIKNLDELENAQSGFVDRFSKMPESVLNLLKLIRIRLLATRIHITQIQETDANIRLYTPFNRHEWNIIRNKTPLNITKYFNWTKPQKTTEKLQGVLLMKNEYLDFDKTFNILTDLFYHISEIILEFK